MGMGGSGEVTTPGVDPSSRAYRNIGTAPAPGQRKPQSNAADPTTDPDFTDTLVAYARRAAMLRLGTKQGLSSTFLTGTGTGARTTALGGSFPMGGTGTGGVGSGQ